MLVEVFGKEQPGYSIHQVIEYLKSFSDGEQGCIWLTHDSSSQLAIMINGSMTYAHYFPSGGDHPGYQPTPTDEFDDDAVVDFLADNGEWLGLHPSNVIHVDDALRYVHGFWEAGDLPYSSEWMNLNDAIPPAPAKKRPWWKRWT